MVKINNTKIKKNSWMQIVINKDDGYINGTKLAEQIGISLHGFFKLEYNKESIEHIKVLTGNKEKYEGDSPWDNVKGVYIHPFLALEMLAFKKLEEPDYQEYYDFLRQVIAEDNKYDWLVDMFDITCSGARGDCHVNIDMKCHFGTSDIMSSEIFHDLEDKPCQN